MNPPTCDIHPKYSARLPPRSKHPGCTCREVYGWYQKNTLDWTYFHNYNELVQQGKTMPLECPTVGCDWTLVTMRGDDNEPVLYCFLCDSTIKPGLRLYERIKSVVNEFYGV